MEKIVTENGIEFIDERQNLSFGDYFLNFEKGYIIDQTLGFVFSITGDFIGRVMLESED